MAYLRRKLKVIPHILIRFYALTKFNKSRVELKGSKNARQKTQQQKQHHRIHLEIQLRLSLHFKAVAVDLGLHKSNWSRSLTSCFFPQYLLVFSYFSLGNAKPALSGHP